MAAATAEQRLLFQKSERAGPIKSSTAAASTSQNDGSIGGNSSGKRFSISATAAVLVIVSDTSDSASKGGNDA